MASFLVFLYGVPVAIGQSAGDHYGLRYDLTLRPVEDRAEVAITLDQRIKGNIWGLRFHIDPKRHRDVQPGHRQAPNEFAKQ